MLNKWFIIAKIKMRETMYESWLSSNPDIIESIVYEEGNNQIDKVVKERRSRWDIRASDLSIADFLVSELYDIRVNGRKDILSIRYNKETSSMEFVRIITAENMDKTVDNVTIVAATANYRDDEDRNVCTISVNNIDNISYMLDIGCRSMNLIGSGDLTDSLPDDYRTLYFKACENSANDLWDNKSIDHDIIDKFTAFIERKLSKGIDDIIKESTDTNFNILTKDAAYLTDGKNVLNLYGSVIEGADPYTFQSLGSFYGKDKDNVYYGLESIEGANIKTFSVMAWEYATDSKRAYFKGQPLDCASINFKSLRPAYGYATDGNAIYYCGKKIEGSDPKSFYAIGEGKENGGIYFGADHNNVYLEGKIIDHIDPKSFEHINKQYFKDKKNVYIGTEPIEGCMPESIRVFNNYHIADLNNVFFVNGGNVTILKDVNPMELRVNGFIAADKKHVYYKGLIIDGADGASANINDKNNDGYILDANSVFYFDKKIPATPKFFETIGFGYAIDGETVFFRDKIVKNADASSFRPTGYGSAVDKYAKYSFERQNIKRPNKNVINIIGAYYKDNDNVYYNSRVIEYADPATFIISKQERYNSDIVGDNVAILDLLSSNEEKNQDKSVEGYTQDQYRVYFKGAYVSSADPKTFTMLVRDDILVNSVPLEDYYYYAKDKNAVYFKGDKILNANPKTFKPHKLKYVWQDDSYLYIEGEIIPYINVNNFIHIEYSFYKDDTTIYHETDVIDGIFPDDVTVLSPRYIKDDILFCYIEKTDDELITTLFEAEINSFDIVTSEPAFAFDRYGMFFRGTPINGIDPETVEMLGGFYIKDKDNIYCGNILMEDVQIADFTILGDGYAFDGNRCFYNYTPLETNNIIHTLGAGYATDGYLFWYNGIPVTNPENDAYITSTLGMIF